MPTKEDRQKEVDQNFDAFSKQLPNLLKTQRNKFALMKNREICAFYTTVEDARATAESFFDDDLYSIQQVTDQSIDLGFFSRAINLR